LQRCTRIIEGTLIQQAMAEQHKVSELPDKEFMIFSLDLSSGMCEGLQTGVESLVANSNLLQLLLECMKDSRTDIRQSAFALVGDLVKTSLIHIKSALSQYIPILTNNLFPVENIAVCNNASWAIGEIAIRVGEGIKPYVLSIMQKLILLMNKQNLNQSLAENTAITIGRLGLVCPDAVAPQLEQFIQSWCITVRNIRDDTEKDSAFRGLCKMIKENPNGVVKYFIYVCDAIASWEHPQQDLKEMFFAILHAFKSSMNQQTWDEYYKTFPTKIREKLTNVYSLT